MTHQSTLQNQPGMSMFDSTSRAAAAPRRAFTLIELLVVIAIISLLMAIAFPAIAVMSRLTRGGAAETTVGIAVRTASAYAGKPKREASNTYSASPLLLTSNGAAILFTPSGDMRILETDLHAFDQASPGVILQANDRFGYTDVSNRDYITLPNNAAVVGILRVGGQIKLIAPPFAVHFDKFGQATTGYNDATDARQMVYYDSNYDGKYDITDTRVASHPNYDPEAFNTKSDSWDATDRNNYDDAGLRPKLPFEVIETVIGILTYQIPDFNSPRDTANHPSLAAGNNTLVASGGYIEDDTAEWLLLTDPDNGKLINAKPMFFSRNSGSILKEYR